MMMQMRVEDATRKVILPQIQYLHSVGVHIESDDDKDRKVSTYFFPSMVFPNRVELLSVTLLYKYDNAKNSNDEKELILALQDSSKVPIDLGEKYHLKHKAGQLITTLNFPTSVIVNKHQPFYFFHKGALPDSCITLAFRNFQLNGSTSV